MHRIQLYAIGLVIVLPACGCALTAKKTPTPAAQLDSEALARTPPPPNERFYLILFGSDNALHQAKYSHTWATLVRATCVPGNPRPDLETQTISWLPTKLDIDVRSRRVEPGANVELHPTIQHCLDTKQKIWMWGPYEVWHGFAHRFAVQKAFLDSGAVGYQCVDVVGEAARLGNGCDCIHAISDMDPEFPRWRYPLAVYGPSATANVVRRFMHSPVTIEGRTEHDWLLGPLGLNDYPIKRATYRGRIVPHKNGSAGLSEAPGDRIRNGLPDIAENAPSR